MNGRSPSKSLPSAAASAAMSAVSTSPITATTTSTTPASGTTSATRSAITAAVRRTITCRLRCRFDAVEVWLVAFLEFRTAFDGHCWRARSNRLWLEFVAALNRSGRCGSTHFCALFFQDGFAREPNPIALDSQNFHQHLIVFFQFVANIFYAMLGDFADVQQAFRPGNDLDESAEISQPRDFPEVGLPYFGRCRQIANDLQGLTR